MSSIVPNARPPSCIQLIGKNGSLRNVEPPRLSCTAGGGGDRGRHFEEQFGHRLAKRKVCIPFEIAIPLLKTDTLGKTVHVKTCVIMSPVALRATARAGNNVHDPHVEKEQTQFSASGDDDTAGKMDVLELQTALYIDLRQQRRAKIKAKTNHRKLRIIRCHLRKVCEYQVRTNAIRCGRIRIRVLRVLRNALRGYIPNSGQCLSLGEGSHGIRADSKGTFMSSVIFYDLSDVYYIMMYVFTCLRYCMIKQMF